MQLSIKTNFPDVQRALQKAASQVPFALSVAMNKTAEKAKIEVVKEMKRVFDRPTPWVLNSLRVKRSTKTKLVAELAYKDRNSVENSRSMVEPHVFSGKRHHKAMEARLYSAGLLPKGYNAVPGGAAKLDSFGNMSQGQISQVLNVLGTYREAGYNKANDNTRRRLAKGNVKRNVYGFEYFVSYGSAGRREYGLKNGRLGYHQGVKSHLQPGVYQRVRTGFGTSLKPILIFVRTARYKTRLNFFSIVERTVGQEFPREFNQAFDQAMKTALIKQQGSLL